MSLRLTRVDKRLNAETYEDLETSHPRKLLHIADVENPKIKSHAVGPS